MIIGGAIVGIFLLVYIFSFIVVGNPKSCGVCHEIRPAVETWEKTSHEKFHCDVCHEGPSVFSRFSSAARLTKDVIPHLTGSYSRPLRATEDIPNSYCLSCHVSWRNVSPSGDLKIPHKKHFEELDIECVYCHSRVTHMYELRGKKATRPPMTLCMQCHNGKKATFECTACHTEKPVPDNHKQPDWLEKHGELAEEIDCGKCHAWVLDYCQECHTKSRPSTHVGGDKWKSLHRKRAQLKPNTCLVCHSRDYCMRCHDEALFTVRLKGKIEQEESKE